MGDPNRKMIFNALLFIIFGVAVWLWILCFTDWIPSLEGLLGLGGLIVWVTLISSLSPMKTSKLCESRFRILGGPGVRTLILVFSIWTTIFAQFGSIRIDSAGDDRSRIITTPSALSDTDLYLSSGENSFQFASGATRNKLIIMVEKEFQKPLLAGNSEDRLTPFLGDRLDRRAGRTIVAVESVTRDGAVVLQGGWVNGLTVGSELRLAEESGGGVRLEVMALRGLGRSEARLVTSAGLAQSTLKSGALLEVVGRSSSPGLRVWMPQVPSPIEATVELARELGREAPQKGIRWVNDPTEETPTHLLRFRNQEWELLVPGRGAERLEAAVKARFVLAKVPAGSSFFVQIPAPLGLVQQIGASYEGIEPTDRPEEADYFLAGRLSEGGVEYSWMRPLAEKANQRLTAMPTRSDWHALDSGDTASGISREAADLTDTVLKLRKIFAWHQLDSPLGSAPAYQLAFRNARDGELVPDGILVGNEEYMLVLRSKSTPLPIRAEPRYVYVFVIDSYGRSVLLFPASGVVENHFPLPSDPGLNSLGPPLEIPLSGSAFKVTEPFGVDTFFLLSSDEPLPNPWILEWDGVRARGPEGKTPLEELVSVTRGTSRSANPIRTTPNWTIERVLVESVASGE